jgi:hypothetical protein
MWGKKMNFVKKIRALYNNESLWRAFVVLQILGVLIIILIDITSYWDFFHRDSITSLFNSYNWIDYPTQSFISVFAIFLPFSSTKAIDWILSAKEK